MNPSSLKLLHIAPRARGIAGSESLLARHAKADAIAGFDAWQIGLFDRDQSPEPRFRAQAFGWRDSPRAMRRRMRGVLSARAGSVVIWHNAWGLPWFADLDAAERRILCLHAHRTHFEYWLPLVREQIDGILAVSPGIVRDALALLPGWPEERIASLSLPIAMSATAHEVRTPRDTWLIGCAGRLTRPQKR